jgi:hypothetical protein
MLTSTGQPSGSVHRPSRRPSAFTCLPTKSMTGRVRCTSRIVASRNALPPASVSSTSLASTPGWRRSRSTAQASVVAVVSCPAASRVSSWSEISPWLIADPSA